MERHAVRVAGFGFRAAATTSALRDALARAGGAGGLTALATVEGKADAAPLRALAGELGLPVIAVARARLAAQAVTTRSAAALAAHGTGSVAEAAALAGAGAEARLVGPRAVSADGMAVAAIAERRTK